MYIIAFSRVKFDLCHVIAVFNLTFRAGPKTCWVGETNKQWNQGSTKLGVVGGMSGEGQRLGSPPALPLLIILPPCSPSLPASRPPSDRAARGAIKEEWGYMFVQLMAWWRAATREKKMSLAELIGKLMMESLRGNLLIISQMCSFADWIC